jgi:solute carrier family 25 citrate transporter 1
MIHDQNAPPDQRKYRGLVHGNTYLLILLTSSKGVSTIIKQEGLGGVYRGVSATILKQSTNQMARFGVFDTIRYLRTGDPAGQLAFWENLLAGGKLK